MQLLSVVGLKVDKDRRAAIVESSTAHSRHRVGRRMSRLSRACIVLILMLAGLFFQVHKHPQAVRLQHTITAYTLPIVAFFNKPVQWGWDIRHYFMQKTHLIEENHALRIQNEDLMRLLGTYRQQVAENGQLRQALNLQEEAANPMFLTRISHRTFDGFNTVYYIGYDDTQGRSIAQKDSVVVTPDGYLVGRILTLGKHYARLLPIFDVSSRVPVTVGATHEQAILAGSARQHLELIHVENVHNLAVGDTIFTSRSGGVYPVGIPVARVEKISGHTVYAKSLMQMKNVDFVLVLARTVQDHAPLLPDHELAEY